jgi:hypothetical protein
VSHEYDTTQEQQERLDGVIRENVMKHTVPGEAHAA